MNKKTVSRVTQVMERPQLPGTQVVATDPCLQVMRMVENGEETRRIFTTIVETAANTPGVAAAAIFLPSEKSNSHQEIVASLGDFPFEPLYENDTDKSGRIALQSLSSAMKITHQDRHYFSIVCVGAHLGSLAVHAPDGLSPESVTKLAALAHHTGVTFERQKLAGTLQHYLDRLQVLNELNQLIASNVGLQRIVKSLARESAFRFAADLALTFLLNEEKTMLEVKGGYGCAPSVVPKMIPVDSGFLGQVMRLGGHLSVVNVNTHENHALEFLSDLGIRSIDACCLEVKGESLGAILIGYRRDTAISQNDLIRFEEFCQAAAVAIANARSQERITSYTERLEELVEQRTADLGVQTARAEEANHAKSQFLANMSHELRTPLTAIVGYSSVLSDGVFGPLNDKQRDALFAVTRSSDHLKNLIDDVLNLARIESGKEVPEPTKVPVKELVTQATKLMQQTALGKSITLAPFEGRDDVLSSVMFCDQKHIHQILINLMSNAVKYTPKGGKVWVRGEVVVDKIKISVTDTGVGVSPEKLKKLFERFERGEDTYSKSQEGTGIGLNLTKRLVELNGGRIGVESTVGEGSTFWIMMPRAADSLSVVTQEEKAEEQAVRLDGLTMVVVDDNTDTCDVLRHILVAAGASVRTANSVKEGFELVNESVPDIVLTDLAIPGESGLVLIEKLRSTSELNMAIPIIVLSACAFEADRTAAMSAGASMFLAKPFKPNEVIRNVRQLTLNSAMTK